MAGSNNLCVLGSGIRTVLQEIIPYVVCYSKHCNWIECAPDEVTINWRCVQRTQPFVLMELTVLEIPAPDEQGTANRYQLILRRVEETSLIYSYSTTICGKQIIYSRRAVGTGLSRA